MFRNCAQSEPPELKVKFVDIGRVKRLKQSLKFGHNLFCLCFIFVKDFLAGAIICFGHRADANFNTAQRFCFGKSRKNSLVKFV